MIKYDSVDNLRINRYRKITRDGILTAIITKRILFTDFQNIHRGLRNNQIYEEVAVAERISYWIRRQRSRVQYPVGTEVFLPGF